MLCQHCHSENLPDAKFCSDCGAKLEQPCPSCGTANTPTAKFCRACGSALTSPAPERSEGASRERSRGGIDAAERVRVQPPTDSPIDGERKTVTALFADIKGSMELMEDLDPEEARAIVDPALKLMIDAVHRYDGYIVQSTGDGIFALFGAPVAHEDHPQRALYAALRMQEDVKRYADKLRAEKGVNLQVRVGANTGEVVVRSIKTGDAHTEYTPIGHSTSLASRLQALAAPGSIAIGENVRKLVEGYFLLRPLGPARVKGATEPVNLYEVTGLGPLRTRLQRSAGRGLTKFVGRRREMDAMKHAAEQAKAGHGQIVAAMAEAGVGKSRLFYEFKAVSQSGWMVLETFSVSHGKASAYLPVIELLRNYFKIGSEDDERTRRERVTGRVMALDRALEDTLPYLFSLLGLNEDEEGFAQIDPEMKKRRTLEAIKRLMLRESLNQPLMVVFEDLHWIDAESQALLNLLADTIGTTKLLMLVNYRPEYSHQWGNKTYYTQLRLDPLGKESADEMLSALLGETLPSPGSALPRRPLPGQGEAIRTPLPDQGEGGEREGARQVRVSVEGGIADLKRLIIERTAGNPFFMEETVLVLFDEGALVRNGAVKLTRSLNQLKIPSTVQSILAARIDRLPAAEKDLLQTLAVIGKEFSLGLVRRVMARPEQDAGVVDDEFQKMLAGLQLGEFIYEQPATGDIEYTFKHALTLEVAYNSVLLERRKLIHARVGGAIETLFAQSIEDHVSELAHHYSRSANPRKAVEFLGRAGEQAAERSAYAEAHAYIAGALQLLSTMPDDLERARIELGLETAMNALILVMSGSTGSPEVEQSCIRVRRLCERVGDRSLLFDAVFSLRLCYMVRGELATAKECARELIVLAGQDAKPDHLVSAHFSMAQTFLATGEFADAVRHCKDAIAVPGPARQRGSLNLADPAIVANFVLAQALCCLGFPDQARRIERDALSEARDATRWFTRLLAMAFDAELQQTLRDGRRTLEQADAAMSYAIEIGGSSQLGRVAPLRAWALAETGQVEEGIMMLRQSIAAAEATGIRTLVQAYCALAEAYKTASKPREGLETLRQGQDLMDRTGELHCAAELYRLRGELTLLGDPAATVDAESCFREAIEVARSQSAKWWELRATVSLARMLAGHGRDQARAMLAEIYNWFTEGFDTADLKDAKALLEELAG